jgi:hypothetical protein
MTLLVKGKHPPYLTSIVVVGKLIARKYLVMNQGWEETNLSNIWINNICKSH